MREKITSIVFVAILAAFFALVMILPKDEQASIQENRPLAEMPELTTESLFEGKFTTVYETYLTDNVGFRSTFVRLGTKLENMRGIQRKSTGRVVDIPGGNRLVLNDGKIMEVFKENSESLQKYIDTLNMYSEKFSEKSDMYVMLVPTQLEFDTSEYRLLADSQKNAINKVYDSVNGFKKVNVYDKLEAHIGEYIYFRTDHHWTQRGAYYGYQAIMEKKGETPLALEDMKANKKSGFLGYLFNQANVEEYREYADEIEWFDFGKVYPFMVRSRGGDGNMVSYQAATYLNTGDEHAPSYGIFMGGDYAFAEIDTNVKNGETALIIKDSYANTVIPFLTNHYEKILVIDPRSFDSTVTQLCEVYEIDDIIFINYALSTALPAFVDYIGNIL